MLERKELMVLLDETLARIRREPLESVVAYGIGVTSGTSGNPLLVSIRRYFAESDELKRGPQKILCLRSSMSTALSYVAFTKLRARSHLAKMLYVDPSALSPDIGAFVAEYSPDEIAGFPHAVLNLARVMRREARAKIASIELSGEGLPLSIAERLSTEFPHAKIRMIYTASEISGIGRSCPHLPLNCYHPFPGVVVEILDPDAEGEGEILVSKNISFGIKIQQYRIGDFGRMRNERCPCGEMVSFEVLGRTGRDYVKLAGALLRRDLFDRAARSCASILDDYRIEASVQHSRDEEKGKLLLRVHHASGIGPDALKEIRAAFLAVQVTPTRTLEQLIAAGIFLPLEILVQREAFPDEAKIAKILFRFR